MDRAKLQAGHGRRLEVYYFRDQQGLEVDLVVPAGSGRPVLVEANASATVMPQMAEPLVRLQTGLAPARDSRARRQGWVERPRIPTPAAGRLQPVAGSNRKL